MRAKTGAGLFVRNLRLIHPTAAISITARCLAHCQLLLGSQPALPIFVPFFFSTVIKQQPIVRGGACRRDRGGKLMKLFDGSSSHGAKGEAEWTSVWQRDG